MKKAYTLVEVLLVVAILGMLIFISVPVYQTFQFKNELDNSIDLTVSALKSAQIYSRENNEDSQWGVRLFTDRITMFKGTSYASRDTEYDRDYAFGRAVSMSGPTELVFTQLAGEPSQTGSIIYSLNADSRTIIINAKGTINY